VLTWGNQTMSSLQYLQRLALLERSTVRVRLIGEQRDALRYVQPGQRDVRSAIAAAFGEAAGESIALVNHRDQVVLKAVGHSTSDLSWRNAEELVGAAPGDGSWLVFLNGEAFTSEDSRPLKLGDKLDAAFVSNGELQRRLFDETELRGTLSLTSDNFIETFSLRGPRASQPTDLGKHTDVRPPGNARVCLPISVQRGDLISVSLRYAVSPNASIDQPRTGRYPNRPTNTSDLASCQAKEWVPRTDLEFTGTTTPITEVGAFLAFGQVGPAVSIADIEKRLPASQFSRLADGHVQFQMLIDHLTIDGDGPLCIGLAPVNGSAPIGREVRSAFPRNGGGIMQEMLDNLFRENCIKWRDENPRTIQTSFPRQAEMQIDIKLRKPLLNSRRN